jgi:pimeloyl-ACP methyl ester carboxylesterase
MDGGVERRAVVTAGPVRLAVREWPGPGSSVLLVHGLASSSHIFDLLAPLLAASFRVVAYDQRGHGLSSKPGSGYGYASVAADALAVIEDLGLRVPLILGHSWGAGVALEVAVRYPGRVSGAVLVDGGFGSIRDRMDWATAREALAPPPLAGMRVEDFLTLLRQMVGTAMTVTPQIEAVALSLMRVDGRGLIRPRLSRRNHMRILRALWQQDALALLRSVTVPTLVLATRSAHPGPEEQDFVEMKREAARAIRGIDGPVRFEWIEGIHDVPLQRPAAVAARVRRFASEWLSGGSAPTRPVRTKPARSGANRS